MGVARISHLAPTDIGANDQHADRRQHGQPAADPPLERPARRTEAWNHHQHGKQPCLRNVSRPPGFAVHEHAHQQAAADDQYDSASRSRGATGPQRDSADKRQQQRSAVERPNPPIDVGAMQPRSSRALSTVETSGECSAAAARARTQKLETKKRVKRPLHSSSRALVAVLRGHGRVSPDRTDLRKRGCGHTALPRTTAHDARGGGRCRHACGPRAVPPKGQPERRAPENRGIYEPGLLDVDGKARSNSPPSLQRRGDER